MPDRPAAIAPRPGTHRRSTDPGRKARRFPNGSARARLWASLRPPTPDDHILDWLGLRSPSLIPRARPPFRPPQ